MSARVLPRLVARPLTLWNLALGSVMSVGFFIAARSLRNEMTAVSIADGGLDFLPGVVAFVGATVFAGLFAYSAFELLSCPFSSGLPSILRRTRDELLALLAFATIVVGAIGVAAGLEPRDAALVAVFAALGFGFGIYSSDPQSRRVPFVGFLTLLAFLAFAIAIPEIALVARARLLFFAPIGLALAAFLARRPFVPGRQRGRIATRGTDLDRAYREFDMRSGTWGAQKAAPRAGAAPSTATRRTDVDWALATLHETQGFMRGGWIGSALFRALVGVLFVVVGQWVVAAHVFPDADRLEQLGTIVKRNSGAVSIWFVLVAVTAPFFPVQGSLRPVARERRGRIAWITTMIEDAAFVGFLLALLAALAVVLGQLRPDTLRAPSWPSWYFSVLVAVALSPIARWARLRFLDTAHGNPGPARQGIVAGITATALLSATMFAMDAWLRASGTGQRLQTGAWIVVLIVTRWIWFELLRQHGRRGDLAA